MSYVKKYDKGHDILHMIRSDMRLVGGKTSEEHPGVYVYREGTTKKVIGVVVTDYEANKESLKSIIEKYGQAM